MDKLGPTLRHKSRNQCGGGRFWSPGRTSKDSIALIEIKDDGSTGRLQSDNNIEKIRVHHREYRNVFWTYRSDGVWVRTAYEGSLHRIVDQKRFEIAKIVFID